MESVYGGDYYYNACRTPWRIAMDYMLYSDPRSQSITDKLVGPLAWRVTSNAGTVVDDLLLRWDELWCGQQSCVYGPPCGGATVEGNQAFLNSLWTIIVNRTIVEASYYGNSIKVISMIAITGAYHAP